MDGAYIHTRPKFATSPAFCQMDSTSLLRGKKYIKNIFGMFSACRMETDWCYYVAEVCSLGVMLQIDLADEILDDRDILSLAASCKASRDLLVGALPSTTYVNCFLMFIRSVEQPQPTVSKLQSRYLSKVYRVLSKLPPSVAVWDQYAIFGYQYGGHRFSLCVGSPWNPSRWRLSRSTLLHIS